jgi:hypothetical protein
VEGSATSLGNTGRRYIAILQIVKPVFAVLGKYGESGQFADHPRAPGMSPSARVIHQDGVFFQRVPGCWRSTLFISQLAAGVEAVKIQDGIEHQRICAARFAAIHRIDGEEHDVATPGRHVHDGRMLRDFIATFEES